MSSLLGAAREVAVPGAAVGDRAWPGGWSSAARCRILEPRWVLRNRSRSWGLRRAMPPSAYVLEGLEYCARHSLLLVCQAYSNRKFPNPFVPPAASAHSTSSTTSQASSACPTSSTTPEATRTSDAMPHAPAGHAPWIPPRQAAPTYAPPQGQQMGGGVSKLQIV
nr:uncharacterized protein LOC127298926 [Lolium perenne]